MSSTLLKVASESSSVVAVVGKGHLQGIKKHWKQPVVVGEHSVICYIIVLNARDYPVCTSKRKRDSHFFLFKIIV